MSIDILPTEILQKILSSLGGAAVLSYSSVCRRWQRAIYGLGDSFWKQLCATHYGDMYEDAHRKAGILWRELFRSLSLWQKVSAAVITLTQIPAADTRCMFILKNRIVSCCQRSRDECPKHQYDTILHFNLDTCAVTHRVDLEVFFMNYAESDDIIAIDYRNNHDGPFRLQDTLRVISKSDGSIYKEFIINCAPWILRDKEVFYTVPTEERKEMQLYRVKLVQNGNNVTFEEEMLCRDLGGYLEDVAYDVNGELLFCAINDDMNLIYIHRLMGTEVGLMYDVNYGDMCTYTIVKKCGFKRTSEDWLSYYCDSLSDSKFCVYSKTVIIRSNGTGLHIYFIPYGQCSHLELHKRTPNLSIDLSKCLWDCKYISTHQIEIVESVNGHTIVIMVNGILFMFELDHSEGSKRAYGLSPPTTTRKCSLRKRKRKT